MSIFVQTMWFCGDPSISDFFWVIGTLFFIDELLTIGKDLQPNLTRKNLLTIFLLSGIIVGVLIDIAFGDTLLAEYSNIPGSVYTPFMKALDLFYFVGDSMMLFGSIYILSSLYSLYKKNLLKLDKSQIAWLFLILGNISQIIGDTLYSYFTSKGTDFVLGLILNYTLVIPTITLPILGITISHSSFTLINLNYPFFVWAPASTYNISNLFYMLQYLFWALTFATFNRVLFFDKSVSKQMPTTSIIEDTVSKPLLPQNIEGVPLHKIINEQDLKVQPGNIVKDASILENTIPDLLNNKSS